MERQAGKAQGIARAVLTPPFRCFWKVTTEGLEHVPDQGGAILAPNHISVLDSFFVPLCLPRRITYVGKSEYMDDWKTRVLFPAMGMIPIDRSGGDGSQRALDAAAEVLEAGELFGIYPEGTRSRNGQLHKGHTGIARLALRTDVPIIPVGIIGSDDVQPPEAKLPSPFRRVHLRFGRAIDVSRYCDRADDRLVLRQITDEVMFEIRNLSGQTYVDSYATRKPDAETVTTQTEARPAAAELDSNVIEFPDRRVDLRPAASLAPSAAAPTPERAAAMASSGKDVSEADGVERRSSASVLAPRPLIGA
ncbi:MAG: lysophospholipid acyltransferase family protein [Microthrixaceae bacterium]